jgi:hypothetical protein
LLLSVCMSVTRSKVHLCRFDMYVPMRGASVGVILLQGFETKPLRAWPLCGTGNLHLGPEQQPQFHRGHKQYWPRQLSSSYKCANYFPNTHLLNTNQHYNFMEMSRREPPLAFSSNTKNQFNTWPEIEDDRGFVWKKSSELEFRYR